MSNVTFSVAALLDEEQPFDSCDPKRGGWALVEVMGHRSHHGFVREVQVFGVIMCEILVPFGDKPGVQSRHAYGGSAIFSLTPCSKAKCLEYAPRPWVGSERQLTAGADDDEDPAYIEDELDAEVLPQRDHEQSPERGEGPEGGAS
jgi:hypothetical protein